MQRTRKNEACKEHAVVKGWMGEGVRLVGGWVGEGVRVWVGWVGG